MKLQQRMRMAWDLVRNKASGIPESFDKWFRAGRSIFHGRAGNTLATNETIFSAVSRLSNSMGTLPLKLYDEFKPVTTSASDMLSNSPNQNMTSFDFIRTLETHRDTTGNGYALKEYDNRFQVKALNIIDPSRVEPVIETDTRELWYQILGDAGTYYVHNMDMIHVKHIHSTGYKGINPLDVLRNTIDFDRDVRKFTLDQLDSSIKASFILKYETHLSDQKKAEILKNFSEFYKENGGVIIQEAGFSVEPISRNFIDTKVFEVEKITRSRVAIVYNMPVHMLGETEGVNYNSMEQMSLEYVQGTLIPIVRQYEQEFNRKLLTREERLRGLYFKFNVNALLRGDMKTRGEFYFKGVRSGLFKPNEIRAWEELPPEDGGDMLYMSRDLSPINERKPTEGGDNKK